MIYTRNKDNNRSKYAKVQNSNYNQNIIQELKQRLQNNKNSKNFDKISSNQKLSDDKNKKKLQVTSNKSQNNFQTKPAQKWQKYNHQEITNQNFPQNNPFSKIKKQAYYQLMRNSSSKSQTQNFRHNQQLNPKFYKEPQLTSPSSFVPFNYQQKHEINLNKSESPVMIQQISHQGQSDIIYDSPIISLYSNIQQGNHSLSNSSNILEPSSHFTSSQFQYVSNNQHRIQTNKQNDQMSLGQFKESGNSVMIAKFYKSAKQMSLDKNVNITILPALSTNASSTTIRFNKTQVQYVSLLQDSIATHKSEIQQLSRQLIDFKHKNQQINMITQKNTQLSQKYVEIQKEVNYFKDLLHEQEVKSNKYEKFFGNLKNVMVSTAMELIQVKLDLFKFQQVSDFQTRIKSINECLARIQQNVEVSSKILSFKNDNRIQNDNRINYVSDKGFIEQMKLKLQQFEITSLYQKKIILTLRSQISQLKQKPILTHPQKPYSYIDQIRLLRHQITRLTQQNCNLGQQLIKFIEPKQNQQKNTTLKQIITLIDGVQVKKKGRFSNKVQYWEGQKIDNQLNYDKGFSLVKENKENQMQKLNKIQKFNYTEKLNKTDHQNKSEKQNKTEKISHINQQQFSTLIKQFKSSLKLSQSKKRQQDNLSQQHENSEYMDERKIQNNVESQQLLTFRACTPFKHELVQQIQISDEDSQIKQKLYKLQVEKQFLISQLDRLESQLQMFQLNQTSLKQELAKFKNQYEILIQRTSQLQMNHCQMKDLQHLKRMNFEYQNKIKNLVEQNNHLKSQLKNALISSHQSMRSQSQQQFNPLTSTFGLTPSVSSLLQFLKLHDTQIDEQRNDKKYLHQILLSMIQNYQNKISQLRQQSVSLRVQNSQNIQYISQVINLLQRLQKPLVKLVKDERNSLQLALKPLTIQLQKQICVYRTFPNKLSTQNGQSLQKLTYQLMMIRSLAKGISKEAIVWIEGQVGEYLGELRRRLPTVQEEDQGFQSLNVSQSSGRNSQSLG